MIYQKKEHRTLNEKLGFCKWLLSSNLISLNLVPWIPVVIPASMFSISGSVLLAPLPGMLLTLLHGLNTIQSLRFVWECFPHPQGRIGQQSQISSTSIIPSEVFGHICMISLNLREKNKLELKGPLLTVCLRKGQPLLKTG